MLTNKLILSGDASSKATVLFTNMEQFQTFVGLKLSYMAFIAIELAITLQSKCIITELCSEAGQAAISYLKRQRSLDNFNIFYDSVITKS